MTVNGTDVTVVGYTLVTEMGPVWATYTPGESETVHASLNVSQAILDKYGFVVTDSFFQAPYRSVGFILLNKRNCIGANANDATTKKSTGLSAGVVVGIVIGVLFVVGGVTGAVVWWMYMKKAVKSIVQPGIQMQTKQQYAPPLHTSRTSNGLETHAFFV
jgi:hypothetical protein